MPTATVKSHLHGGPESMRAWERAEIERSDVEASLSADRSLRVSERTWRRYAAPPAGTAYPLEYAYHQLGDVRGQTVLDFGCGSGANTVLLANRGARVLAVDISESLLRLAARRLEVNGLAGAATFIAASAHDLPMPSESVDVVFGIAILHHLDLALVSREVHRVLRPGGRAIFQEPVRNSAVLRFVRRLIPYRAPDISPFERPLFDRELRAFAAPFRACETRAFGLPHVRVGELLPRWRRHPETLYHTDAAMLAAVPALARYAAIRVMTLTKQEV
jgi:SAM-dependent methyltransferase